MTESVLAAIEVAGQAAWPLGWFGGIPPGSLGVVAVIQPPGALFSSFVAVVF